MVLMRVEKAKGSHDQNDWVVANRFDIGIDIGELIA
jgi:hypothetical protein